MAADRQGAVLRGPTAATAAAAAAAARSSARVEVAHARMVMVLCGTSSEQPMKKVERYAESFEPVPAMFAAQHPPASVALGESGRLMGWDDAGWCGVGGACTG